MRANFNSLQSVSKFLRKYHKHIDLIKGDTNLVLKEISILDVDFVFLDGVHSYTTVTKDLEVVYQNLKGKQKIILSENYGTKSFIHEIKDTVDNFININNLTLEIHT